MTEQNDDCYPVKRVHDVLSEEKYYIWVYDKEKAWTLKDLGLQYFDRYEVNQCPYDITIDRKDQMDMNLGHTYLTKGKYPGITVLGEEKEDKYKIAVLGNSQTDSTQFPFKVWPEFLYDELKDIITVYNGAVAGYTSGQELIKFIRDILPLKPDMVIVYDGYMEVGVNEKYPFAFRYGKKAMYTGIESKENCFGNWLSNIRNMYAIAKERGIKFFCFCQPWLGSKEGKNINEKSMLLSIQQKELNVRMKKSFREYMVKDKNIPDYIYDFSHIFDKTNDVYLDYSHVGEEGNRIIAREIEKIILPELMKEGYGC